MLRAWDTKDIEGWFLGTVHSRNVTRTDLQATPTANFVIKYTVQKTGHQKLNGLVACELSARTHGVGEWWVQVVKDNKHKSKGKKAAK